MFYQYFDGYSTNGMVEFKTHKGLPGSTKHWGGIFQTSFTKKQFRSEGKKLAMLSKAFILNNTGPPPALRPHFDQKKSTISMRRAGIIDQQLRSLAPCWKY
jgi:hypothetical protein